MADGVYVYLERRSGAVSDESLQALTLGAKIAGELGITLVGFAVGGETGMLEGLPGGVSKVFQLVCDADTGDYRADVYGAAVEAFLKDKKASVVLFPPGTQGEDLASILGAGLGCGSLLGVRDVKVEDGNLKASRAEFEGKVLVDYAFSGAGAVLSIEEGVWDAPESASDYAVEEIRVDVPGTSDRIKVVKTEVAKRTVNLKDARVIVSAGAGVGNRDNFRLIEKLAGLLGGEIGATRAAVDAGWVSYDRQIGQTGVKVKPELYVACGISGAAQHRVGMLESGTVVSINSDPHAPVFKFSHYCVEGDLKEVLPKMIEILSS